MKNIVLALLIFICLPFNAGACTIFNIMQNDSLFIGRNFDYFRQGGEIRFIPAQKNKYGLMLIEQYGRKQPFEGINDQGLFIGIASVPNSKVKHSFFKAKSTSLAIVRRALERAKTVDEAIEIFKNRSIIFGRFFGAPLVHYMIVDKEGNSAIIEYIDKKFRVKRKTDNFQVMTNFFVTGKPNKCKRFHYATQKLSNANTIKAALVKDILKTVSSDKISHTIWSSIYDIYSQKITIYTYMNYNQAYVFDLEKELKKGKNKFQINELKFVK